MDYIVSVFLREKRVLTTVAALEEGATAASAEMGEALKKGCNH